MRTKKGLTLIELTLYIAIVSMFMLAITTVLWNIVWGKNKNIAQNEVYDNLHVFTQKIQSLMDSSSDINITNGNLIIEAILPAGEQTIILNNDGRIYIGNSNNASCTIDDPCPLTSNLVEVTDFNVSINEVNGEKLLNYSLELSFEANSNQRFEFAESVSGSILLKK